MLSPGGRAQPHQFRHRSRRQPSLRMTFLGICARHAAQTPAILPSLHRSTLLTHTLLLRSSPSAPQDRGTKDRKGGGKGGSSFPLLSLFPPFPAYKGCNIRQLEERRQRANCHFPLSKKEKEKNNYTPPSFQILLNCLPRFCTDSTDHKKRRTLLLPFKHS